MLVRVKDKGIKLSGRWCFKNQEIEIDEPEYEKNRDYVDIINEDENTPEIPQIPGEDDKDEEDIELQELRKQAKKLGISRANLMKKEKLEKAIAEKTAPLFGDQSTDNNTENNYSNEGDDIENVNKEENPQEQE